MRARVLRRDHETCFYCGAFADEVDHREPVALGGDPYDEANLVASCGPCNAAKGGRRA